MSKEFIEPNDPSRTPLQELQLRIVHTQWHWRMWKQLYLEDPADPPEWEERMDLLTRSANGFFVMLRRVLFEAVILGICRIADKPTGGKRLNLSVSAVFNDAKPRLSVAQTRRAEMLLSELEHACELLVRWRNREIAHLDHDTAMWLVDLPDVPFPDVDKSIGLVIDLLKLLSEDVPRHGFLYEGLVGSGSAAELLASLGKADELT